MLTTARAWMASQREASKLVRQAETFSLRLPVVGRVSVPPPDQLAFFGVLGLLAAVELIDWPVALAIGIGQAVVARHFEDEHMASEGLNRPAEVAPSAEPAAAAPARKTAARNATPRKAASRKAAPRKTAARKAAPRKAAPAKAMKSTKQ